MTNYALLRPTELFLLLKSKYVFVGRLQLKNQTVQSIFINRNRFEENDLFKVHAQYTCIHCVQAMQLAVMRKIA